MSDIRCEDGMAGIFPRRQVDLASFIPLSEMDSVWANDVWGWTDPVSGRELALAKLCEGTAFVDITDATNPTYLGTLPSPAPDPDHYGHLWGGLKTYGNHAFIGSEATDHGIQIFDLTRRRTAFTEQGRTQVGLVDDVGQSHDVAINEESGKADLQMIARAP